MLEQLASRASCFVTLTYAEEPAAGLNKVDPIKFVRALRDQVGSVRYFISGEYGDLRGRAHYHLAVFGVGLPVDHGFSVLLKRDAEGRQSFECVCTTCALVRRLWAKGHIQCHRLTEGTAQYLAGYVTKKLRPLDTASPAGRGSEFVLMSRRPGLGTPAMAKVGDTLSSVLAVGAPSALRLPRALAHGRRTWPLGRFLTRKLREAVGVSEAEAKAVAEAESLGRQVRQVEAQQGDWFKAVTLLRQESRQRCVQSEGRMKILSQRKAKL